MPSADSFTPEERLQRGRQLIEVGNSFREIPDAKLQDSLDAYDAAEALLAPLCVSPTSPFQDDLASAWINRGIALMGSGDNDAVRRSLLCFDKAIELRTPLLALGDPLYRYNLMGVWINRGDANALLGGASSRTDAIADYEAAIRIGTGMGPDHRYEPSQRFALAHLNRGSALLLSGDDKDVEEANRSLDASIAALLASREMHWLMAASAWEGKAEAFLRRKNYEEARSSALRSMHLVGGSETTSLEAMTVSLKARIALCVATWAGKDGETLSQPDRAAILGALDAADDGLRLARGWSDAAQIRPLVRELFRFGVTGFASMQPQFLSEFVEDFASAWSDPGLNAELRPLAVGALRNAMGRLASEGILNAGLPEPEIGRFAELRQTLEQLK